MSLSNNSKLILEDLENENSGLVQTNAILPDRRDESIIYINRYEDPAKKLDERQEAYTLVGQINDKKRDIVTLCDEAFNNNCPLESNETFLYGDGKIVSVNIIDSPIGNDGNFNNVQAIESQPNPASFNITRENGSITSVTVSNPGSQYFVDDILTIKGTDVGIQTFGPGFDLVLQVAQTDEDSLVFSETGSRVRVIGVGDGFTTFQKIAFGVIRRDRIRVIYYPVLEDQDSLPQTNNSQEGLIFPRVTPNSQFRGKGRNTILASNSTYNDGAVDYRINDNDGNWGIDGIKRGSGWSGGDIIMGNFYKLNSDCDGRRSQINQLRDDIAALRLQINQILQPIEPIKDKKHGFQLQSWSYRRSQQVNINTINTNDSLKDFINDPNNSNIFG